MLSFLHAASETVDRMSSSLPLTHPWIASPRKADYYFKAYLTKQGIKNAVLVNFFEAREQCHHFKKNNQVSAPLFSLSEVLQRDDKEAFLNRQVFASMEVLHDLANNHLATKELWSRLKRHQSEPLQFLDAVRDAVLETEEITADEMTSKTVMVFLENYKPVLSSEPILFFSSRDELIRILRDQSQSEAKGSSRDVFGDVGTIVTALPKIKAGGLVQFSPYERNASTAAYARYGLNSVAACPLTEASQKRIYSALMTLTLPRFRNKIWSHIREPIGKKKRKIEYVDRQIIIFPDLGQSNVQDTQAMIESGPIAMLDCIENPDNKKNNKKSGPIKELAIAENTVQEYKRLAEPIIAAMEGKTETYPGAQYHISVTRKFDKGASVRSDQRSVLFSTLTKRLRSWLDAISAPTNRTFGYFAEGKWIVTNQNEAIRPFEIPGILNCCWKQNAGIDSSGKFIKDYGVQITHHSFNVSAALDLFLFHDRRIARAMLDQIARYHIWLMYDVVHRDRHIQSILVPSSKNGRFHCRRHVFKLLGLISILYRIQENIMSQEQEGSENQDMPMEISYRMGRVLAIADLMHRKKFKSPDQFPATFVGESFFPSIIRGSQIREYWSRFGSRVDHIRKWARTQALQSKEGVSDQATAKSGAEIAKLYFWFVREAGKIEGNNVPDRFSSSEKCLFMSGFYSVH